MPRDPRALLLRWAVALLAWSVLVWGVAERLGSASRAG